MISKCLEFPASWFKPTAPGFGTFPWPHVTQEQDYETVARAMQSTIEDALKIGYRHLDSAFTYRNQDLIGAAIKAVGVLREDVFLTSKLHPNNNNYQDARAKIKEAIQLIWSNADTLDERYLDAFLLHYPGKGQPIKAWRALQESRDNGIVRHIGVSNFEIMHIEALKKKSGDYPEINQIEFHPWNYPEQEELLRYCLEHSIAVEGYSPLAQGLALKDHVLLEIANVHKTTSARILLKWCMQHGVRPIVGSMNSEHLRSNAEYYDFELSECEMQELNAFGSKRPLHISQQWHWNPKKAPLGDAFWKRYSAREMMVSLRKMWRD